MVLSFTGFRPKNLPFGYNESHKSCINLKAKIRDILIELIENEDVKTIISGFAQGADQLGMDVAVDLKKIYTDIYLEGAIPCVGQELKWSLESQTKYKNLLDQCNKKHIISPTYTQDCMRLRNMYLVDRADIVLAIWDEIKTGGTSWTVGYAKQSKKKIIILNPITLEFGKNY